MRWLPGWTITGAVLVGLSAAGERSQTALASGRIEGRTYTNEALRLTYHAPVELQAGKPPQLLFVNDGSGLLASGITVVVEKRDASVMAALLSAKEVTPEITAQAYLRERYAKKDGVRLTGKPEKHAFGGCSGARAMSRVKVDKKRWRGSHYACIRDGYAIELAIFGSDEMFHFLFEQKATNIRFE